MGSSTQWPVSRFASSLWRIAVGGQDIGEGAGKSRAKRRRNAPAPWPNSLKRVWCRSCWRFTRLNWDNDT